MTPAEAEVLLSVGDAVVDSFWSWYEARENHAIAEGIDW